MTSIESAIAKVRELDSKATKGPWFAKTRKDGSMFLGVELEQAYKNQHRHFQCDGVPFDDDNYFIAASRTLLPQMAKALEICVAGLRNSCWGGYGEPGTICESCNALLQAEQVFND